MTPSLSEPMTTLTVSPFCSNRQVSRAKFGSWEEGKNHFSLGDASLCLFDNK